MPLTATELAYIARIVDGEGSIMLSRSGERASQAYAYPQVKVANTDKRLIDWLKEKVSVGAIGYTSRVAERKDVHHWGVASNQAYELLIQIRPFLVIKAQQADVAIALWEENAAALKIAGRNNWGNYHPVPQWLRDWRNASFLYMKDLNRRGRGSPAFGRRVLDLLNTHNAGLAEWTRRYAS